MAQVKGKLIIDSDVGVVGIEVPERGLAGMLRDKHFTAEHGALNGAIGTYQGVPVRLQRRPAKR
jgi:hypothetical protein